MMMTQEDSNRDRLVLLEELVVLVDFLYIQRHSLKNIYSPTKKAKFCQVWHPHHRRSKSSERRLCLDSLRFILYRWLEAFHKMCLLHPLLGLSLVKDRVVGNDLHLTLVAGLVHVHPPPYPLQTTAWTCHQTSTISNSGSDRMTVITRAGNFTTERGLSILCS